MKKLAILSLFLAAFSSALWAQTRRLDTTTLVVMGEGLAAGMSNFSLSEEVQSGSFPAQIARQVGTLFPQPLIQAPGIGSAVGFPELPVMVTRPPQTTLRAGVRNLFVFNLSVPGLKLADAITRRPTPPLVHHNDAQQTTLNMLLGFPALLLEKGSVPLWAQLEYAENMRPTFAIIELGYYDVLEAAVKGDPGLLPAVSTFRANYETILEALRAQFAEVLVMTIPDPIDTAYFTPVPAASRLLHAPPFVVLGLYDLTVDDLITVNGLNEIGSQFLQREIGPLSPGAVLGPAAAGAIRARVQALNTEINSLAQKHGAVVYDLNALFRKVRAAGIPLGPRKLTADYLDGFYSLNGYYPGVTGHAVIANEVLELLNRTYGRSFPLVKIDEILSADPAASASVAQARRGETTEYSFKDFPNFRPKNRQEPSRDTSSTDTDAPEEFLEGEPR